MIRRTNYNFTKKVLYINNVNDYKTVTKFAEKAVQKNIIDEFIIVKDYAKEVLDFFDIQEESFKGGYYYSIAELVGIYLCKTKYLLHFSSDSMFSHNCENWINEAIERMEQSTNIGVANPMIDADLRYARREAFAEDDNWFYSYGFSDQCYLIKQEIFNQPIYGYHHEASERYPKYGGELFEKRVDSFFRHHNLVRISHKTALYRHKNFPKGKLKRGLLKLKLFVAPHNVTKVSPKMMKRYLEKQNQKI